MGFPDKTPFTDKELKHDIRLCRRMAEIVVLIGGILAIIGIIIDVANIDLGLETMKWLLLATVVILIILPMLATWAVASILHGLDGKGVKKK